MCMHIYILNRMVFISYSLFMLMLSRRKLKSSRHQSHCTHWELLSRLFFWLFSFSMLSLRSGFRQAHLWLLLTGFRCNESCQQIQTLSRNFMRCNSREEKDISTVVQHRCSLSLLSVLQQNAQDLVTYKEKWLSWNHDYKNLASERTSKKLKKASECGIELFVCEMKTHSQG